jgi:hypothetical protein
MSDSPFSLIAVKDEAVAVAMTSENLHLPSSKTRSKYLGSPHTEETSTKLLNVNRFYAKSADKR